MQREVRKHRGKRMTCLTKSIRSISKLILAIMAFVFIATVVFIALAYLWPDTYDYPLGRDTHEVYFNGLYQTLRGASGDGHETFSLYNAKYNEILIDTIEFDMKGKDTLYFSGTNWGMSDVYCVIDKKTAVLKLYEPSEQKPGRGTALFQMMKNGDMEYIEKYTQFTKREQQMFAEHKPVENKEVTGSYCNGRFRTMSDQREEEREILYDTKYKKVIVDRVQYLVQNRENIYFYGRDGFTDTTVYGVISQETGALKLYPESSREDIFHWMNGEEMQKNEDLIMLMSFSEFTKQERKIFRDRKEEERAHPTRFEGEER